MRPCNKLAGKVPDPDNQKTFTQRPLSKNAQTPQSLILCLLCTTIHSVQYQKKHGNFWEAINFQLPDQSRDGYASAIRRLRWQAP